MDANDVVTHSSVTTGWVQKTIDLTNYSISGTVKARFEIEAKADTPSYHVLGVDDIAFREQSDTVTWYGTNNKQWSDPTNWENGKPGANSILVVPNGKNTYPKIKDSAKAGQLLIKNMNKSPTLNAGQVLELKGKLVNNGKSDIGNGKLILNGNKQQLVKGSSKTLVDSLKIANRQGVKLKSDFSVEDHVNFANGIVRIPNNNTLIVKDNASAAGSGNAAYVDGSVKKIGDDAFTFPIGDNGQWARLGISAPSNNTDAFTASYQNKPFTDTSTFASGSNLHNVSQVEYWNLDRTKGSSNVDLTLYFEDGSDTASNVTDISELKVVHWNGSAWKNLGKDNDSGDSTAGNITVNDVSSFSPFTFGSDTSNENPLPVELITFDAQPLSDAVLLKWKTASETNNSHFIIQKRTRKSDGWRHIGRVDGQGTTLQSHDYSFKDPERLALTQYYRLKQVDYDGSFEYSEIEAVESQESSNLAIEQLPNPVRDKIQMSLSVPEAHEYRVQVKSIQGKSLYRKGHDLKPGTHDLSISMKNAAKGIYIVSITGPRGVTSKRVMLK